MKKILLILTISTFVLFSASGQTKKKSTTKSSPAKSSSSSSNSAPKTYSTPKSNSTPSQATYSKSVRNESTISIGSSCFSKGNKIVDLGIGVSGYGFPIHGGLEYLFTDDISGGVSINYSSYSYFGTGNWTFIYGGPKGNYHFNRLLKLKENKADLYAGLTLGYWYGSYSSPYNKGLDLGNTVYLGVQVGGRYYFSNNIGIYAEAGGGNLSSLNGGITFKF